MTYFPHRNLHAARLLLCAFLLLSVFSCEKAVYGEDEEDKQEQNEGVKAEDVSGTGTGDKSDTSDKTKVYTVAEFKNMGYNKQVWVQGYIVGTCYKDIKNADFSAPFDNDTAVLLADKPGVTDADSVITVGIGSKGTKKRNELNLCDNPSNYGKQLKVYGLRTIYQNVTGINTIDAYQLLD